MIRRSLTALVVSSMLALPAVAQDSGTEAEREACTPDVFRLCQDFIPSEGPIVACLKAKRVELSSACSLVMFPVPAAGVVVRHARKRHHHHAHN